MTNSPGLSIQAEKLQDDLQVDNLGDFNVFEGWLDHFQRSLKELKTM